MSGVMLSGYTRTGGDVGAAFCCPFLSSKTVGPAEVICPRRTNSRDVGANLHSGDATMRVGRFFGLGLSFGFCMLLLTATASAQSDRGTIAGSVLDSSGAAIKDASVTLRAVNTANLYQTKTTGDGLFRISDLQIGRYDVTVAAAGFKNSVHNGVEIQISTTTALNVTLEPGSVNEEVTV